MAVASATGRNMKPISANDVATALEMPRASWVRGRAVRISPGRRKTAGPITSSSTT